MNVDAADKGLSQRSQRCIHKSNFLTISRRLFSLYILTTISSFSSVESKEHTGSVQLSSFQEQQLAFK